MKEYSAIVAVGELGKAVVEEDTMQLVGIQPEHIVLQVLSDPDDFLKSWYLSAGDLSYLCEGDEIDTAEPGIYKISFNMSEVFLGSVSLEQDEEYETEGPVIQDWNMEPATWPFQKETEAAIPNLIDGGG